MTPAIFKYSVGTAAERYLGSGKTIFLLARAAGVHFDFSIAIK